MTVAGGTAALAISALWPGSLDAGDTPQPPPPGIAQPKLTSDGVELTLNAGGSQFAAGDQPALELVATNTQTSPAELTVHVTMFAASLADALSRVVPAPVLLWQRDQPLALAPREGSRIILPTETRLPPRSLISLRIETRPRGTAGGITALSFATPDAKALATSAPHI